jgi:hypothetical protein
MAVIRLSVKHLSECLNEPSESQLSYIFIHAGIDTGGGFKDSIAGHLTTALGCENLTIGDFVFIPRTLVENMATHLDIPNEPVDGNAAQGTRKLSAVQVGRCLKAYDFAMEVAEAATVADLATALEEQGKAASPVVLVKSIKLSNYVSQEMEGTTPLLNRQAITACEDAYKARLGILPLEGYMPSPEQLSALKHLLDNDIVPYVDFALWGPYNKRFLRRKAALVTFTPDLDTGNWRESHKLIGPTTFDIWFSNWCVYRTSMVMLDGAETERLDQYAQFIRALHEKYTAKCWWLIYQADVRLRSEKLGRLVTDKVGQDSAAIEDKLRWSKAFTKATDVEHPGIAEFWNAEVHRPAAEFKNGHSSHYELAREGSKNWLEPTAKRPRLNDQWKGAANHWSSAKGDKGKGNKGWKGDKTNNTSKGDKNSWKGKGKDSWKDNSWKDSWKGNSNNAGNNNNGKGAGKHKAPTAPSVPATAPASG